MSVVIFCFILTQSLFKVFLVLRYKKLMTQAKHKWEIWFSLILVYLMYFIFKKQYRAQENCTGSKPVLPSLSLKSTEVTIHVTGFNIKFSAFCAQCICVPYDSQCTEIICVRSTNWLVLVMEMICVYCEVSTQFLQIMQINFRLRMGKLVPKFEC